MHSLRFSVACRATTIASAEARRSRAFAVSTCGGGDLSGIGTPPQKRSANSAIASAPAPPIAASWKLRSSVDVATRHLLGGEHSRPPFEHRPAGVDAAY